MKTPGLTLDDALAVRVLNSFFASMMKATKNPQKNPIVDPRNTPINPISKIITETRIPINVAKIWHN